MATLEEIENNNRAAKSRRKIAGFSDKRWMEEIDWLIAEIRRLREELELEHDLIAEVRRLRWAKWELTNNYAELETEVKWLRKQLEVEHDQGESFLTQIKELRAENERLKAELDGFIHGGL